MEKICKTCDYYFNKVGLGQCWGQKNMPRVDDNGSCKDWKLSSSLKENISLKETSEDCSGMITRRGLICPNKEIDMKKIKYVLIFESGDDFQQCIGIYDNKIEACGAAYHWLDRSLDGELEVGRDDGMSISPLYPLGCDGDVGWGMKLVGNDNIDERVHILIYEYNDKSIGENKESL